VNQISSQSDDFSLRYGDFTIFKMADPRIPAILNVGGPIIGSLKSPYTTSYRSSIETIALDFCFFFEKNRVFVYAFWRQTDKETNRRTDGQNQCVKALSLSRAAP